MSLANFFLATPRRGLAQITSTTGLGTVTILSAGAGGTIVNCCILTYTAATIVNAVLSITNGTTTWNVSLAQTNASAGFSTSVPAIDLLNTVASFSGTGPMLPHDPAGNHYIYLASGESLIASLQTAISSGTISIYAAGGDF